MKIWFVVPIFIVLGVLALAFFVDIPSTTDVALSTNSTITAGRGEICFTPYTPRLECSRGLECVLFGEEPQTTGVCIEIGSDISPEDIEKFGLDQFLEGNEKYEN